MAAGHGAAQALRFLYCMQRRVTMHDGFDSQIVQSGQQGRLDMVLLFHALDTAVLFSERNCHFPS